MRALLKDLFHWRILFRYTVCREVDIDILLLFINFGIVLFFWEIISSTFTILIIFSIERARSKHSPNMCLICAVYMLDILGDRLLLSEYESIIFKWPDLTSPTLGRNPKSLFYRYHFLLIINNLLKIFLWGFDPCIHI